MRAVALVAVAICFFPVRLAGQAVTGQVSDTLTGQPMAYGFVVLLDRNGTEIVRVLSGRDGRFRLKLCFILVSLFDGGDRWR